MQKPPLPLLHIGSARAEENSIKPSVLGRMAPGAKEAERLERLAADSKRIEHLMFAGYEGPEWDRFRGELAELGIAVLRAWILSGRIFRECAAKGRGIRKRRAGDRDDATELALETVAHALVHFRENVLIPGVWNPERGATLSTFFIGACILFFPNVYRAWLGERLDDRDRADIDIAHLEDRHTHSRPDRLAEVRDELAHEVDALDDARLVEILVYESHGHTHGQIADLVGTSAKAVECKLRRYRLGRDARDDSGSLVVERSRDRGASSKRASRSS